MNICFSTLGCTDRSLADILDLAVKYDVSGLEIRGIGSRMNNSDIPELSAEKTDETVKMFGAAGVKPIVLGTSCKFHDAEKLNKAIKEGRESIDIASRLKIPYIRVFGNNIVGDFTECAARVANGITQLCEYARGTGVSVLLEVHGDFITAQTLSPIVEKLREYDNFGLIWDIAHTHRVYREGWREFYDAMKPHIRHVHIKDVRDSDNALVLTGQGNIPIRAIADTLISDGYSGYFSLEWEKKWHPELDDIEVALACFKQVILN